jgi:hypothetical protein
MATFTTPMRLRWPVRARDRLKDLGARRPSLNHLQRRQINSAADGESCARSTRSSWGVPLLATSSAPRPGRTTRSGPLRYASLVSRAPAALMGFAPFAGLLPQSGGWRVSALAGPTCRWLHATSRQYPATVFVAADRAALERQMSGKGGRSNEVRYVMRRLLGFDSRLRSAAAGMKPAAAILPWAFCLSQVCRAHIRVRTRATVRTIAPSPASATPSDCHPLMGFAGDPSRAARRPSSASDADASPRALRPPRHPAHDARDPQHIAGPFSVLRG